MAVWLFSHGLAFGLGGLVALAAMTVAHWWDRKERRSRMGCVFCAKRSNREPFLRHGMKYCPACGEPFSQYRPEKKVCPECGAIVKRDHPLAVYCSHACQERHNSRIQGAKKRARKRAREAMS